MKSLLSYLLLASLFANAYLWWQLKQYKEANYAEQVAIPSSVESVQREDGDESVLKYDTGSQAMIPRASPSDKGGSQEVLDVPDTISLAFLRALQKAQDYDSLSFYVRNYLREHPQDIEALLLEAEAYYYTQPLNAALVNYYGLKDAPLNDAQLEQINKLIDVNTTRIIQQFSGDGSWNLLAAFLEPLIQVDPLNRRYIMALAKAYGMQEQTVLMENVLAALPADDARAQRLRDDIYNPVQSDNENLVASQFEQGPRPVYEREVLLTKRNGQYYTQAVLSSVDADLLIDTGASASAISEQVFERIKSKDTAYLGMFNVQTAGGMLSSPIYKIAEVQVGEEVLSNVSVMVLPTENMRDFDGLLGMNVIRHFNIAYDASADTMRMYKRKR